MHYRIKNRFENLILAQKIKEVIFYFINLANTNIFAMRKFILIILLQIVLYNTHSQHLSLVYPKSGIQIFENNLKFTWNTVDSTISYNFKMATDEFFENIVESNSITENFYYNDIALENGTYFWKVEALIPNSDIISSDVFYFTKFIPEQSNLLKLWLVADTAVVDSAGFVKEWGDISGNNHILTQSDKNKRPAVHTDNFQKSIVFNGLNSSLQTSFNDTFSQPISIFVIWKINLFKQQVIIDGIDNSNRLIFNYPYGNLTTLRMYAGRTGGYSITYNKPLTEFFNLHSLVYSNPSKMFDSGILKGSIDIGSDGLSGITLGSTHLQNSAFFNGEIAELLIYNTEFDDINRKTIENYLMDKYAPPVNLGYDIRVSGFCDTTIVGADKPWFIAWEWSTGDTTATISVNQEGKYWVKATNIFGKESNDTINIYYPYRQFFTDTIICFGESATHTYNRSNEFDILWSDGSTSNTFSTMEAGIHNFSATDTLGCIFSTDFTVIIDSLPATVEILSGENLCAGNSLSVAFSQYEDLEVEYLWHNASQEDNIEIWESGMHSVSITNSRGCVGKDSMDIVIQGLAPVASFSTNGVCLGETSIFTNNSHSPDGSEIIQTSWSFGDGNDDNNDNAQHTYLSHGSFEVNMEVTTANLCKSTYTELVAVYSIPKPQFSPTQACANTNTLFLDNSTDENEITEWLWKIQLDDETLNFDTQNLEYQFNTDGDYAVSLISTSAFSCKDSVTHIINVKPNPLADFQYTPSCFGDKTWFNNIVNTSPANPILQHKWTFPDGSESNAAAPEFTFSEAGTQSVSYKVKLLNGCQSSIEKDIEVWHKPQALFTLPQACNNEIFNVASHSIIESGEISEWQWFLNENFYHNGENISLTLPEVEDYKITLIVGSGKNCKDTLSQIVAVKQSPQAQFYYNYDEVSVGYLIHFSDTSAFANSYFWDFGDGSFSTEKNPAYEYAGAGEYLVNLVVSNDDNCSDTVSKNILITEPFMDLVLQKAQFVERDGFVVPQLQFVNMGNRHLFELVIDANVNSDYIREIWTGNIAPAQMVDYELRSQIPLKSYENMEYACAEIYSPLFLMEENMENNRYCISTAEELTVYDIYPNPTNNNAKILIASPTDDDVLIEIVSLEGRSLDINLQYQLTTGLNIVEIPLHTLKPGFYYLIFKTANSKFVRSLVKV